MSQQLTAFMEKLLREISEGVPAARRVRLLCGGDVYEVWEPLQASTIEPETWAREAEGLIQALIPELPKRRVQLQFVAEDVAGATIGTVLRTVTGQNASAQDIGTQNGAKALADAIASVAKTTDQVGEMARKMMEFQAERIEKLQAQLDECHELFMAIRRVELDADETQSAAGKILSEQVQQAAPLLMALVENWAKQPKPIHAAASGAVAATTAATNGAH